MSTTTEAEGTVADVTYAATSRLGNSTQRIALEDGRSFLTKTDSSASLYAQNLHAGFRVTLRLNGQGRVTGVWSPDDQFYGDAPWWRKEG